MICICFSAPWQKGSLTRESDLKQELQSNTELCTWIVYFYFWTVSAPENKQTNYTVQI